MSMWVRSGRPQAEQRQTLAGAWTLSDYLGGGSTFDTVRVASIEDALRSIAVSASADLIASLGSELPIEVYSGDGRDKRRRPTPGYLDDPAGDGHGRADWVYQLLMSWLMRGNLYGEVLDERGSVPTQVDIWHPDQVSANAVGGEPRWYHNGQPVTDLARFVHRRVNPLPGVLLGQSVVSKHALQIGLPQQAQRYGSQWFTDGAHPSGVLQSDAIDVWQLNDDQVRAIKARFMAGLRGSREPALVGKAWKFNTIQVSPEESQFLSTVGATEAQCCRMFGPGIAELLGYESGNSMNYANIESRLTHVLVLSIDRWFRRVERILSWMLPQPQYAVLDRDAALASTTLTRYQAHGLALRDRWKVVNEVREEEDLPPVPWGNEPNPPRGGTDQQPAGDGSNGGQ